MKPASCISASEFWESGTDKPDLDDNLNHESKVPRTDLLPVALLHVQHSPGPAGFTSLLLKLHRFSLGYIAPASREPTLPPLQSGRRHLIQTTPWRPHPLLENSKPIPVTPEN